MVGWHHQLNGHEFEQIPGDSEGQGSLACCSSWGCRVRLDLVIEQQPPNVGASPMAQWVKNLPAMQEPQEVWVRSLGQEDPLEEEMGTQSSILA